MLTEIFTIIAPIFLCASLGVLWARSGTPYDSAFVTRVVMNIGMPCLVLSSLNKLDIQLSQFAEILLVSVIICLIMGVAGLIFIKLKGDDFHIYLPSMMYSNVGNMGLPLCLFAFGNEGLALALGFFITFSLINMSLGVAVLCRTTGGIKERVFEFMRQPIIYAIIIGLLLLITHSKLPLWIGNSVDLLGGLSIPLMLLTLGVSLTSLHVAAWKRALSYALFRILGGFCIAFMVATMFNLADTARGVTLIQSSMPVAVINYLLAQHYDRSPNEVAGMVVLSTLLSFVLLPFLLVFVLPS